MPPEPAAVTVVAADPARAPMALPFGSRFNTLAQSDDGRLVVAHLPLIGGHPRVIIETWA